MSEYVTEKLRNKLKEKYLNPNYSAEESENKNSLISKIENMPENRYLLLIYQGVGYNNYYIFGKNMSQKGENGEQLYSLVIISGNENEGIKERNSNKTLNINYEYKIRNFVHTTQKGHSNFITIAGVEKILNMYHLSEKNLILNGYMSENAIKDFFNEIDLQNKKNEAKLNENYSDFEKFRHAERMEELFKKKPKKKYNRKMDSISTMNSVDNNNLDSLIKFHQEAVTRYKRAVQESENDSQRRLFQNILSEEERILTSLANLQKNLNNQYDLITDSMPTDKELDEEVWEGWTPRDFIEELEPLIVSIMNGKSIDKPFKTKAEMHKWIANNQPYYKKPIRVVEEYFDEKYFND